MIKTLEKLSLLNGVPGNEKEVAKYLSDITEPLVDEMIYDHLGSVIGRKGDKGPKVLIGGHLDEVGLMVTKITKDGYIKFQTLGGWYAQVMLAQEWQIHTTKGVVYGVTGAKPPHMIPLEDRSKATNIDSMYIDIGVSTQEEAKALGVELGQMITPSASFRVLGNGKYLLGKAFDNRAGSAVVYEVLKELKTHQNIVYGAYTVQEEVGTRGAKTVGYTVKPDIAIAVDTGIGNDVPGGDSDEQTLGKGPQIILMDGGLIGHHKLRKFVIDVAEQHNIAYQEPFITRGSTDGKEFHLAGAGAPTIALCIPTRYMHSHTSIIHIDDVLNTVKLIIKVLEKLDEEAVHAITFG